MRKVFYLSIIMLFFAFSCNNSTTQSTINTTIGEVTMVLYADVVLYDELGEVWQTYENLNRFSTVELPYVESEGKVFIGWTDGEEIYYPEIIVSKDIELTPVFEVVEDVFEYNIYNEEVTIYGYSGNALYLRIPELIEGNRVTSISSNAFYQLDIIEVKIPNTVLNISMFAFKECLKLKSISFYGDYFGEMKGLISAANFDNFISSNADTCIIDEIESETSWTYQAGCPVKAVTGKTEVVIISGIEFYQYHIIYDLRYYDDYFLSLTISDRAFSHLPELKSVEFSSKYYRFSAYIFEETPKLSEVVFSEENNTYEVVDNVVYSEDLTVLYYHPNLETVTSFVIPETVVRIYSFAFGQNSYLESVYIGENIEFINLFAFGKAFSLEEIIVSSENSKYFSVDGVLFERVSNDSIVLVSYPLAKIGSSYVIPSDVAYIADSAFAYNDNLEEVILNDGLVIIGDQAFLYTENITEIDIPASVERIGYYAFGRSGIKVVIIRRSVVVDGSFTLNFGFDYLLNDIEIYVPDDSFDEYYNNELWSMYKEFLKRMSEYPNEE